MREAAKAQATHQPKPRMTQKKLIRRIERELDLPTYWPDEATSTTEPKSKNRCTPTGFSLVTEAISVNNN